jgi:hypothetical protein
MKLLPRGGKQQQSIAKDRLVVSLGSVPTVHGIPSRRYRPCVAKAADYLMYLGRCVG